MLEVYLVCEEAGNANNVGGTLHYTRKFLIQMHIYE